MLIQVWKNVVGNKFPYIVDTDRIVLTVPRGSSERLYDFSLLLSKMEKALDKFLKVYAELNQEGLLQMTVESTDIPIPDGYYERVPQDEPQTTVSDSEEDSSQEQEEVKDTDAIEVAPEAPVLDETPPHRGRRKTEE